MLHQDSTILLAVHPSTCPIEKSYYSDLLILLQEYLIPKQLEKLPELHLYTFKSELAVSNSGCLPITAPSWELQQTEP